jgi:hypothetical protein
MNVHVSKTSRSKEGTGVALLPESPARASQADAASLPPGSVPATPLREADSGIGPPGSVIDAGRRRAMIAEAAYYRAELRGFDPGHELEDWFAAEFEIDCRLASGEIPAAGDN